MVGAPQLTEIPVNPENLWRLETPGAKGWARSVRPGSPNKYFMVSVDSHLGPPPTLFAERIDAKYRNRLPRLEKKDGEMWLVQEGMRNIRMNNLPLDGEDLARAKSGGLGTSDFADNTGATGLQRIADQDRDGVDAEVIFPNGPALQIWSTSDVLFSQALCRIWNDWAWQVCAPYQRRCMPAAAVAPGDLDGAVAEVQRIAKMGYKTVMLPSKPIFGPRDVSHVNYNLPHFDPLWAAIQDSGMPICLHIATGEDPRAARGNGGAVMNYAAYAQPTLIEPVVALCASGVLDRFPRLRFATIEANAGWLPWLLETMDEVYRKHHMWVRPKLKHLPSDYFRSNGASSFGDDRVAMMMVEPYGLEDNLMWANDYPHQEGLWPHSAEAIERVLGGVTETTRAKLLGLNAARFFGFEGPA